MLGTCGAQPPALMTVVLPHSDGDAEDGEQGPIWTFPPTIRPSPHSKLHKGSALHGPQKVWPARPPSCARRAEGGAARASGRGLWG